MKIILNKCYGGFDVSEEAYKLYAEKKGLTLYCYYYDYKNNRMVKNVKAGSSFFKYYFTKDFGYSVEDKKIDWSTHLYLDSGHRDDPILIEVVEELGKKASGSYGNLVIVEIPDGMNYVINNYDGVETLHENVRV